MCYVQILLECQQDCPNWRRIIAVCLQLLEDTEVRVRESISSCTRLLAEQHDVEVVQSMQDPILQSIQHNWVSLQLLQHHASHVTRHLQHMRQSASLASDSVPVTCPDIQSI